MTGIFTAFIPQVFLKTPDLSMSGEFTWDSRLDPPKLGDSMPTTIPSSFLGLSFGFILPPADLNG